MHKIKVWDLPTRLFHWLLVAFVLISWFTGEEAEDERGEKDFGGAFGGDDYGAAPSAGDASLGVHEIAGYAVLALLFFRLFWGLVGGEHARFWNFVRAGRPLADYVARLLRLAPPSHLGHNPLGGWMIVLLLLALGGVVVTGIYAQGGSEGISELHEGLSSFLMGLAAFHVFGVIGDTLLTGDNLTWAMVTGYKKRAAGGAERDARESPLWLAGVGLAAALAGVGYIVATVAP